MPTVRYQIRNEYGLADPELYQAADKDDPEAILEGVAMAGLVGVLRQLGDLAEFAAQVFHDLHEEVTATAARGHGLLLRVQQLEAEFPSIEKAFLVQTSHSHFAYNDGIDWSTNLRMDQNLVTQGDMPRFILDSYEECRGPPRLFMLDKFDVAGAGACSKRYSDPSFFKVKFASSGMMEEEVQWEKKARKTRKKASRWRNGETIESFLLPLINSNLMPENSVQVSARVPARRVKLKSRNLLDSDITNRKSYMEHLLEVHSPEQKVWSENPITHSPVIIKSIDSSGLTPKVHETVIDAIADSTIIRETYPTQSPTRKYVSYIPKNGLENHKVKSVEILEPAPKKEMTVPEMKTKVSFDNYISEKAEKRSPPLLEVDQMKPIADREFSTEGGFDGDKSGRYRSNEAEKSPAQTEVDPKKSLAYAEFSPEDEYDEYKSDDISSDVENYMDALNTMETGVQTDSERRDKLDRGISSMEAHRIDSGICEEQKELQAQLSEPDSVGKSTPRGWNNVLEHPPHNTVIFGDLADTQKPLDHVSGFCVRPPNQDNFLKESPDETLDELQGNDKVTACASSVHLLPNGTCNVKESDVTNINSELGEASSGSCVMDLMSGDIHICPQESDKTQSVTSHPDDANGCLEGTHVVSQLLHCKGEELPDSANSPNDNSGESIPLSEMGDLSFERKDVHEGTQPAEFVEEQTSELIAGKIDMPDHLPETKHESSIEEIPAQHTGESTLNLSANSGKQEESIKEEEACSDGSVSPNIPESFPEISSNDVKSSKEVSRDLDGTLPHTDDTEFTEPIINLRISSDDLLPLSDIPVVINSTEVIEPVISEDMKDVQGKTIPEEVCFGHVEDSPVSTVQLKASQDPEIFSNDVKSSKEVSRDLDGTLPHTDDTEFTEPIINLRISSDDLLPLSDIPVVINSTEDIEPVISEDMKDVQGKTIPEEVCFGHVEDSPVSTVQLKASQDPIEQDNRTSSRENMFPPDAALSLENNQFIMQPDVPPMGVRNVVAGVEDTSAEVMGERKTPSPKIVPLELEYFSDVEEPHGSHEVNSADLSADCSMLSSEKETSHDGMQLQLNSSAEDAGKSKIIMPNIKPLEFGHYSDVEEPQEIHDADSGEHLPLDSANAVFSADMQLQKEEPVFMVTFDSEEPKESHHAAPMEHLLLDSANKVFTNDMQFLNKECGIMVRSDSDNPKKIPTADSAEHFPLDSASEVFRDDMELQNGEIGCMLIDGVEPISGTLRLPNGSAASNSHKESLQHGKHTESDDSLDEYIIVEADDSNQGTSSVYSVKASGLDVQLQENYLPKDAVPDQHDMEADSSDLKNLTLLSRTESQPILSTPVLSSKLPVLLSSNPSYTDCVCRTIPSQPNTETENLVYLSETQDSGSNDGTSPSSNFLVEPEIPPGDDSEPNVGSSHHEGEHLEASDTQFQKNCTNDNNLTQRISRDIADQPPKPEPSVILSNGETNEFDTSLTNLGVHEDVEDEASVASRCSSVISLASLVSSHSAAGLPPIESSTTSSETSLQEAAIANSSQAISETSLQEAAIPSSSQTIAETNLQKATIASSTETISESSLQEATIASSSQAISETCLKETSEPCPGEPAATFQLQDVTETPPLPPLPPMQWRLGKVRLGSLTLSGDIIQPPIMTNPVTELMTGDEKHTQGPITNAAEIVRPENSFASLPVVENGRFQHRSLISEAEVVHPSRLSELPPIAEERQQRSLILEREMTNPSNPFLVVSDRVAGKFSSGHSAPVPAHEDWAAEHPQLSQEEPHHGQHRRPQLGHLLPSLELERSQHEVLSVAKDTIPPVNPLFAGSSTEEWRHQYGYGVYGGESVQHPNFSVPFAARGLNVPPYGFLYSMGENPSNVYDYMIPTVGGEKPNWTYRSIRDRPRDPLIEAVAAHDKSKLRKVSELDHPSVRPKADERDSLLEQIRNKSFNLKPANAAKPNIKGVPPTNLKVAAILEKANAIRQACAGSDVDDDDDGDNWSDS